MYRSEVVDEKTFAMRGYQCDLHPNPPYLAMIYGERERGILITRGQRMVIDEAGKKTVTAAEKPEPVDAAAWQTYEVICRGNKIIHKLNGQVAIDLTDNYKDRIKQGKIGLQLHRGGSDEGVFSQPSVEAALGRLPRPQNLEVAAAPPLFLAAPGVGGRPPVRYITGLG
jgi:hypothetical protein